MKKKHLSGRLSLNKKTISLLTSGIQSAVIGGDVEDPTRITLVSVYNPCAVSYDCGKETCDKTGCPELTVLTIRNPGCNVGA
ncbi:class I lanthipeptide [Taibaiella helva]|uniref:class I lanthipeptide n=1 Tax=Taibaiella helva TaxID=2301235 RepID=UPI0013005947|nr:class I lanthipeptide [Taibaiella helva]